MAGPGEVGLNTDSSVGGLFGRHTITDRQLCEGGHQARLDGLRETRGPKQGWWPWPEEGLCLPAIASGDKSLVLALRVWKCSSPFGQWSGEGG